jgi:ArsR family transcriptional regulator
MPDESLKRALLVQFATVAKALAHEHRLQLLEHLAQGERSVEVVAKQVGLTPANASQHLHRLRRAGLLASRRNGKHIIYRLATDSVVMLLSALRSIAASQLAEVEGVMTYFRDRDSLEPVSNEELLRRMRDEQVIVLDVRPQEEFALGHLPGAINVPLPDLARRLEELPRDQNIVAYCRGPYCAMSYEAVVTLRQQGFNALRLQDGYPEWKAAGFPVEASVRL